MAETGRFRKDFFSFKWHKREHMSASQWSYIFPQGLRWIVNLVTDIIAASDRRSLLKLDTEHLKEVVIENIGHYTFQEAFDKTGRIINITVAPLNHYDPPRLLNYLTAPHVCVWSAAVASCAIPGMCRGFM
jgi:TAG lipase/steryl ester hydrolase/phospholipase A2/LPA acyltransferase